MAQIIYSLSYISLSSFLNNHTISTTAPFLQSIAQILNQSFPSSTRHQLHIPSFPSTLHRDNGQTIWQCHHSMGECHIPRSRSGRYRLCWKHYLDPEPRPLYNRDMRSYACQFHVLTDCAWKRHIRWTFRTFHRYTVIFGHQAQDLGIYGSIVLGNAA
jgi:hypothetical protein